MASTSMPSRGTFTMGTLREPRSYSLYPFTKGRLSSRSARVSVGANRVTPLSHFERFCTVKPAWRSLSRYTPLNGRSRLSMAICWRARRSKARGDR